MHDEVVDVRREWVLADETWPNDVDEDWCLTWFVHRHCRHNWFRFSLWRLSSFCNDDFETRFSLESMTNSRNVLIDHDLERSDTDFYRNVSPIPSLVVE